MARPRHPNAAIEAAVRYAEDHGWTFRKGGGHAFLVGKCPAKSRDGHAMSVWSTPKSPENHVKQVRRKVDACSCTAPEENDDS